MHHDKIEPLASAPLKIEICESDFPLADILSYQDRALAVIIELIGTAYRPLGATMVCDLAGRTWGNLSSGCIERDVALHAIQALRSNTEMQLRYGQGSPFKDLTLPCGGGLKIAIFPRPRQDILDAASKALRQRRSYVLELGSLQITLYPQLRFLVFGKGPEAASFSQLAQTAGYLVESFGPDQNTMDEKPLPLTHPHWPQNIQIDARTAVALFFHDHEWEPPILAAALRSPAFYIGAQGSLRTAQARHLALYELGFNETDIARLAQPFGLIPSVRDPSRLAISVLAQILSV